MKIKNKFSKQRIDKDNYLLNKIMNAPIQTEESQSSFAVPLFIGLIIGILIGAPIGVLLMKRKNKEWKFL